MPEIVLNGDGLDPARVQSVMFFPHDPKLREQLPAVVHGMYEPETVSAQTVSRLVGAPSDAAFKLLERESQRGGGTTGDMLLNLYLMDKFELGPSMNKAIFVCQEVYKGMHYSNGRKVETSEPAILKKWRRFRSVAHLWGAYRYTSDPESAFSEEGFSAFLGVASMLFMFGSRFCLPRVDEPLLKRSECWTLPFDVPEQDLPFPGEPERLKEVLSRYKKN